MNLTNLGTNINASTDVLRCDIRIQVVLKVPWIHVIQGFYKLLPEIYTWLGSADALTTVLHVVNQLPPSAV